MNESEPKSEKPKDERRFSQEQYDMLKRCSDKKDMTEWNEWRKNNPLEEILLEGADLFRSQLEGASLWEAHLEAANLIGAHLEGARVHLAQLQRVKLTAAHLEGASFQMAIVDGATMLWEGSVDRDTYFVGVGLDNMRIDPGTKQLLEYNIRRKNWEYWYKEHPKLKWLVKPFWWMSDYGISTSRIVFTFFGLAIIFANIYYHWGRIAPPGIVKYLFVDRNGIELQWWLVPLRTLYFSIVTMTTLGFGDMYANAQSILGHLLLMLQVILGYVLLGALVTRFAVLFTAGGPAGRFAKNEQEKKGQGE